jgi:hypothetical protein
VADDRIEIPDCAESLGNHPRALQRAGIERVGNGAIAPR